MLKLTALSTAERAEFRRTLGRSHEIKVAVQVLDNEHRVLSTISHRMLDGQVNGRSVTRSGDDIEVSRDASMTFLDPDSTLSFDSDAPTSGAIYLNRMVRIIYSVRCPSRWVDVTVFTGPVVKVDRDGAAVTIEAQGKEAFGLGEAYNTYTFRGRKVDAFRALLGRTGEAGKYVETPASKERLTKTLTVARESKIWIVAYKVMRSMDRLCFYDGRGVCRTPKRSYKPVINLSTGNDGLMLSEPQVTFSTENMKNAAWVKGGKPKGSKHAVSARVVAPASHPLSPYKLGRNGDGVYHMVTEENTNLRTTAKAVARARSLLAAHLAQEVEVSFESLPIPHLEPWDAIRVTTDRFAGTVSVRSFALPLMANAKMTIGYAKRITNPRYAKIRSN